MFRCAYVVMLGACVAVVACSLFASPPEIGDSIPALSGIVLKTEPDIMSLARIHATT